MTQLESHTSGFPSTSTPDSGTEPTGTAVVPVVPQRQSPSPESTSPPSPGRSDEDQTDPSHRDANDSAVDAMDPSPDPSSKRLLRDAFYSSVFFLFALTIVQKVLGFFRSIVICRYLDPDQLGIWSMTATFVETFVPLLMLSIPACFGRYFEHYEQKGQLKGFIRQSSTLIAIVFPLGLLLLVWGRGSLSRWIYGSEQYTHMVIVSLGVVVPFAIFGIVANMLTGLRRSKTRSLGEFINGVSFTLISVLFVLSGNATALAIVAAFAIAYSLAAAYSLWKMRTVYRQLDHDQQELPWVSTWRKLAPLVLLFWLTDFLTNLFYTVDRYMIVNLSTDRFGTALDQVGNYEAAHVMPLLFSSMTAIVARVLLPYLAQAWEAGDREKVFAQVRLSIKVGGVVLVVGAMLFLLFSKPLFDQLFQGKYESGLTVLPLVVFFYICSGLSFLLINYFWCCERGGFAIQALSAGLVVNVVVNSFLLARFGIWGAAVGTACATSAQLLILIVTAARHGLKADLRLVTVLCFCICPLLPTHLGIVAGSLLLVLTASGVLFTRPELEMLTRPFRKSQTES